MKKDQAKIRKIRMLRQLRETGKKRLAGERAICEQRIREAGAKRARSLPYLGDASPLSDLIARQALRIISESREAEETEAAAMALLEKDLAKIHAAQARLDVVEREVDQQVRRAQGNRELADILSHAVLSGLRGSRRAGR